MLVPDWKNADPKELEPHFSLWMLELTAQGLHAKSDIAIVLAMLSAQVAELKKDAERLTTVIGMMFDHSLHFRMVGNSVQLCTNSTILGQGIGANDAIDAAKEGKC